jgi:beta-lactamase regulating signal transducer with metallopeptidase domain
MIGFVGFQSLSHLAMRFLPALLGSALRASIIFAIVCAVTSLMKNTPPRPRHPLWLSALLSHPVILTLLLLGPYLYLETPGLPLGPSGDPGSFYALLLQPAGAARTPYTLVQPADAACSGPWLAGSGVSWWWLAGLLAWLAGAWLSYARVILGRLRLRYLKSALRPCADWEADLHNEASLLRRTARRTRILSSPHSRVPFTCGLFRPLIVLPEDRPVWTHERLRAVLHHELGHVRRDDVATQELARVVCSLFWFVPFVWMAYNSLYLEREKACDVGVVLRGVERRRYAACLLEAARASRDPVHLPGLVFPRQRKRILEERIRSIVRGGGTVMKNGKSALVLTVAASCVVVLASCVHVQRPLKAEEGWARLVGTWVNHEYQGDCTGNYVEQMIIKPGFVGEGWNRVTDTACSGAWTAKVKKTWTDWRGNTYCQYFFRYPGYPVTGAALMRVDRSGKVLELNSRTSQESGTYPEVIDPRATAQKSWYYFIYYRE